MLEKAIRDLEKMVAECKLEILVTYPFPMITIWGSSLQIETFFCVKITARPPAVENQETDASAQAIKRRLPTEIKLKLAKVARLAVLEFLTFLNLFTSLFFIIVFDSCT